MSFKVDLENFETLSIYKKNTDHYLCKSCNFY